MAAENSLNRYREYLPEFIRETAEPYCGNRYFSTRGFEVYLSRSWQPVHDNVYVCLDIANVSVYSQRKGTFKRLLAITQELCPWNAVHVEFVRNVHLERYLRRLCTEDSRWVQIGDTGKGPSFFWLKDTQNEYTATCCKDSATRAEAYAYYFEGPSSPLYPAVARMHFPDGREIILDRREAWAWFDGIEYSSLISA